MRNPVFTAVLLSVLLLSGVIATSMISFIGAEASSDKQEKKKEKDKKDYYDNYDKVKDVYESTDHDSYKMPMADQYSDGYQMNDYTAEADQYSDGYQTDGYVSEKDNQEKYKADDKGDYKNNDKKAIKKIKIIECKNTNVNGDELEDLETVETMKSENPIVKQLENKQLGNQMNEYDQYNGGVHEYYIGSDTKIIFICTNDNYNLDSNNNIDTLKTPNTGSTTIETTESGDNARATVDSNDNADTIKETETTESGDNATATGDSNDSIDLVTNEMISGQNTDSLLNMDVDTKPNYLNIMK
ncbi:MAG: hypothetical protein ACM3XP_04175 [Nitrososphaerales archaeon]